MSSGLVSVIVPVYNQADHIRGVVSDYLESLRRLPGSFELLLITNGCRDNSIEVCDALASEFENVRAIHHDAAGWGNAVIRGIQESRGDLICYTNSARTTAGDLLLPLVYATVYPHVVVKANRKIRSGVLRRLGSLIYNLECRALFDLSVWDVNGTPKVFPRSFSKLLQLKRRDDLIDAEFNVICRREAYPIIEIPVFSSERHGGKSTTSLRSAVGMYVGAYRLWRELNNERRPRAV